MTGTASVLHDEARAWVRADPDPQTRAELEALLREGDDTELSARFDHPLTFGTAGLRGPMGAGPGRMNRLVVQRATAGLMAYLRPGASVVVGHDSRLNSDVFARDVAEVVAGAGGRALVLPRFAPTPLVAFAVRHLHADAGVVCTASHNPPNHNGYKVYLDDGAQILPPADRQIAEAIARTTSVTPARDTERIVEVGPDVERSYVQHVVGLMPAGTPRADVSIVYSALHGVGARLTTEVFEQAGLGSLHLVDEQCLPDGTFRTVRVPNPELEDATRLARARLRDIGADVALVHDPDADRLGVIVPTDDGARPLTGGEIGMLLADHVLRHSEGDDRLVVDTVVSSSALAALAAAHGVHHARTLTGFKWIVRPAMQHPELRFVFGYEEALGFSVDAYVRDKDAISSAAMFADLVHELKAGGSTVEGRLRELALRHGLFSTRSWSVAGPDAARVDLAMAQVRDELPATVGGRRVVTLQDYSRGTDGLPPADLLELTLEDGARICLRPSGTEAKLKIYAEVVSHPTDEESYARAVAESTSDLEHLRDALVPFVSALLSD